MKKESEQSTTDSTKKTSIDNDTRESPIDIKERSIKGGTITLITQLISYATTVISVMILARLLTPEDYGIIAMVMAITGFVNLFQDLGLSGATIQSPDITHEQLSALFWINTGLGALLTILTMASAPIIAWIYDKPELILVTIGISLSSLFSSLGTQHKALLNRYMQFKELAIIQLASMLIGLVVAVLIALNGGHYWALVSNLVIAPLGMSIGLWMASDFRPGWYKKGTKIGELVRFGVNLAGFDLAYYFHDNTDRVLIGRTWGAEQLGLYTKAYSLLELPLANLRYPLNRVAFPAMSRIKDDPVRYRAYYIKYCSLLAFISMPLVGSLYLLSEPLIRIILGDRWIGAAELFEILAFAGFIQTVASLRTTVMTSSGYADRLLRWGIANTLATIAAFICGLPWGAKGVAIAYSIVNYLILHPSLMYSFKNTPVRPADFYTSVAKPAIASIIMCILYVYALKPFLHASDIILFGSSILFCIIVYLVTYYIMPGGKRDMIEYINYLSIIVKRSK